ncbi:hypothetical protein ACFWMU_19075 [Streptomyces sp. NPDC058357]|uniref:hypothetical protein n=1 Tax=unclassified Streptomyces TaxID=2593676 RepID=UPI0036658824
MILLRPLTSADAPTIRRIYGGAAVTFPVRPPMTGQEAEEYAARAQEWARQLPLRGAVSGLDERSE